MTIDETVPRRLYLLQLSTTNVPLPSGQTLEMSAGCYLIMMSDGKYILVDSGMPPDVPVIGMPPATNEKNVLGHLVVLGLRPEDISTVICTHFDVDHSGYHDAFPSAEFLVQREHYAIARGGHPRFAAARAHWDDPVLRYRMIDGDSECFNGIKLLETSGHAPGHQSVLVRLPKTGAVLLAIDAVVMQRLFTTARKAWPTDDNEQQLRASTKKLLDVVEHEHVALVVFGHDGAQWKGLKKPPEYYE
jgi:N-acyl homoserine lactone hydrolase